ncbi:family 20 glycosylhydrolase [Streptomyces sp. NPDC091271]|uniref:family 20 glycosylhydrolase n=1 Tax=Streptomyces sp. NPDC091271 TaxID=3365980 RepID=UPI00381DBA83
MTSTRAIKKSKAIVDEFAGWFDAPLFSIGAEEVPGQLANCPCVKDFLATDADVTTLGDLLNRYINTLDDVVRKHGRRTAVYNGSEHLDAPQQTVHTPVVFLTWEGTGGEPVIPGHDEIAIGPFYVTPNNYHHLYPDEPWMYDTWTPSGSPDMLGSGLPNWADYNFWAADEYFEQHMAGARAILADRAWNATPTPGGINDLPFADGPHRRPARHARRAHGAPHRRRPPQPPLDVRPGAVSERLDVRGQPRQHPVRRGHGR